MRSYRFNIMPTISTKHEFEAIAKSLTFSVYVHACLIASSYSVCHPYLNQLTRLPSLHINILLHS
ncbi:hypothetical protein Hanom_Chr16g01430341 [Helianthus anomalus]